MHRDLKPDNILVDDAGIVTLLDFGLVKRVTTENPEDAPTQSVDGNTVLGAVMGTWQYMSPEQSRGAPVDARSDVFSLGAVFYEMLTGKRPFGAPSQAEIVAAILYERQEPVRELRPDVDVGLAALIERCLEKDATRRFESCAELNEALTTRATAVKQRSGTGITKDRGRPRPTTVWVAAAVAVLAAGAFGLWRWSERRALDQWARQEAIPEVLRLVGENRTREAAELALEAETIVGADPVLEPLWPRISSPFMVTTDPPGAELSVRPYESSEREWRSLGQTPYDNERFPVGAFRFRIEKDGFETIDAVRSLIPADLVRELGNSGFDYLADPSYIVNARLQPTGTLPEGMIAVAGGPYGTVPLFGFAPLQPTLVPDYLIDRTEVTNSAYAQFVAADGYLEPALWKEPFRRGEELLSWEAAMAVFQDSTGRRGPSTWILGRPPDGKAMHPVGGVSWFEASAFCRWRNASLPTLYHWARAALPSSDPWTPFNPFLARASNFDGEGPKRVASNDALGASGAHDLAGNVREWVSTAAGAGRYLLGGAWSDPIYWLHDGYAAPPWERDPTDGFRCARYPEGEASI